ncbi:MAG: CDP-glucose 4,6-dehydratase [Betaproteobacteria bacterium]|nr:CDP-glucose 4,6-dehydratase [Betaproteobacteria bacterium]
MTPGFWRDRRVLVTGHTGFKGGWLSWWLHRLGARVTGLALDPPSVPSLFDSSGLGQAVRSVRMDVRDLGAMHGLLSEAQPEIVFHLAAQSLVREGYRSPVETFQTNVVGTVHCLEAARACPSVRAVVVVTSDKCYRDRGRRGPYAEEDELGGEDPYAASKACAEIATHAYRASYFSAGGALGVASARAGNVVGGGDWAMERLVPDAMRAFLGGTPLVLRNPGATRPWQHVLEPLHGYLMLAEALHAGREGAAQAWNFGPSPEEAASVAELAEALAARWGAPASWRAETPSAPPAEKEAADLAVDSAKARSRLGWRARLPLAAAVDWIVDWHKRHAAGEHARDLTLEQLERYEALCLQ